MQKMFLPQMEKKHELALKINTLYIIIFLGNTISAGTKLPSLPVRTTTAAIDIVHFGVEIINNYYNIYKSGMNSN